MRVVADRFAQLCDQTCEVPLGHENSRPERLHQLLLGNRPGTALEKKLEQAERLDGKMNSCPPAKELAGIAVENAVVEAKPHASSRGKGP